MQIPSLWCPPAGWRGGALCSPAMPDSSSNHNHLCSVKSEVSLLLAVWSLSHLFLTCIYIYIVSLTLVSSQYTYTHTRVNTPTRFEAWASLSLSGPSPNTTLSTPLPNFAWSDSHWPGFVLPTTRFPCLGQRRGEESGGWVSPTHPSSGRDNHPSQVAWDIVGL